MAFNMSVNDESLDIAAKHITSNTTLNERQTYIYADSDGNSVQVTLPQGHGGSASPGKIYIIKRKGSNPVTITHHANDRVRVGTSINNWSDSAYTLSNGTVLWLIYAGSYGNPAEGEWHVIAEFDGSIG